NSRDASVHADGAKSRFSKRLARALWRRNSLRVAMQNGGRSCPGFRLRDCGPHPAQTEQSAQTALVISLSQCSTFHFASLRNLFGICLAFSQCFTRQILRLLLFRPQRNAIRHAAQRAFFRLSAMISRDSTRDLCISFKKLFRLLLLHL